MDHHLVVTFHYQQQEVFVKIVKFYSRHIPRQLQRLIEFVVLCAAISSLCLLIYAHSVVKHLPKRCVDTSIAQNALQLTEFDVLRVDLAMDAPPGYALNDSYAKEFSLFGLYNALFDGDPDQSELESESDVESDSEYEHDVADAADDAASPPATDSERNSSAAAAKRKQHVQKSARHLDDRHPTDSLFANLCSSLYLMVTGGLARTPTRRTRPNAKRNEPLASANFIRQLARHFPPAAFAVVGSDALFASANADRFVVEFSKELGLLKLSADVRHRLSLRTALWYFAPRSELSAAPDVNVLVNHEETALGNLSTQQCEAMSATTLGLLGDSRRRPTDAVVQARERTVRLDSAMCFGSQFDRFLFDYAFGYDDYLIGVLKRYAELLNISHGYVRNVMNGEYYRYRTGGTIRGGLRGASRWETVLRSGAAMCAFTWLVSTLLRHSHEQIFALIVALLRHLETNWTLVLPASPLFVIVLGLLGAQVLLATVFRTDSPTAFFLLVGVWFSDHFYALVSAAPASQTHTARVYFARFFYAYQLAFYVHYALEAGLFAGLALVTYALFLLHAAVYLFHHHHLPLARAARARARRLRRSERLRRDNDNDNVNVQVSANANSETQTDRRENQEADVTHAQGDAP